MKALILGAGISYGNTLEQMKIMPAFRKASSNMMMAYESIIEATKGIESFRAKIDDTAFVLGSSYGELENTKEFLKTFTNSGLARPLLFQSSLHNGTLGFLALELKMKGPSFTVSQFHFTGEKCLELALSLLQSGVTQSCLVTVVDLMGSELLPAFNQNYSSDQVWRNGAASIVLVTEAYALESGLKPLACLERVKCFESGNEAQTGVFSDSDAIIHLINSIRENQVKDKTELKLPKSDRSYSIIQWSK